MVVWMYVVCTIIPLCTRTYQYVYFIIARPLIWLLCYRKGIHAYGELGTSTSTMWYTCRYTHHSIYAHMWPLRCYSVNNTVALVLTLKNNFWSCSKHSKWFAWLMLLKINFSKSQKFLRANKKKYRGWFFFLFFFRPN